MLGRPSPPADSAAVGSRRRRAQFCRMSGVAVLFWLVWEPTATTVPSLRVVTANSELDAVPGFGLLMIVQLVPSQCSINVAGLPVDV